MQADPEEQENGSRVSADLRRQRNDRRWTAEDLLDKIFKTSHLDFGTVDWADTGKRLLAIRHESGGMLTTSEDGGATWMNLGKGFSGCGVFDHSTFFVATKEKERGIFRSADAGATWTLSIP